MARLWSKVGENGSRVAFLRVNVHQRENVHLVQMSNVQMRKCAWACKCTSTHMYIMYIVQCPFPCKCWASATVQWECSPGSISSVSNPISPFVMSRTENSFGNIELLKAHSLMYQLHVKHLASVWVDTVRRCQGPLQSTIGGRLERCIDFCLFHWWSSFANAGVLQCIANWGKMASSSANLDTILLFWTLRDIFRATSSNAPSLDLWLTCTCDDSLLQSFEMIEMSMCVPVCIS